MSKEVGSNGRHKRDKRHERWKQTKTEELQRCRLTKSNEAERHMEKQSGAFTGYDGYPQDLSAKPDGLGWWSTGVDECVLDLRPNSLFTINSIDKEESVGRFR